MSTSSDQIVSHILDPCLIRFLKYMLGFLLLRGKFFLPDCIVSGDSDDDTVLDEEESEEQCNERRDASNQEANQTVREVASSFGMRYPEFMSHRVSFFNLDKN